MHTNLDKKTSFSSFVEQLFSFTTKGLVGNGFGGNQSGGGAITFYWILSGQSSGYNIRGLWTDDGVWISTNTWLG